ncbi:MAG TPA: metallophosphoesterase [Chloroflexia bacterium]|nr:metallophosphoesterase [Chloroflexia bacterium]
MNGSPTTPRSTMTTAVAALLAVVALVVAAVTQAATHQAPTAQDDRLRFAVIGDYGYEGRPASEVAALVASWQPDLVITTGDNNYPDGAASTIDRNIGRHYAQFIAPYRGIFGPGAAKNQFFPSLGNHDWHARDARPYLEYFTLPGNERYYDFAAGPVHFFALDSDDHEPDGNTADSRQAAWLRDKLARAREPWRVVYMHHPPYSSGDHGNTPETQWPYEDWGATAVLGGHDHSYERIQVGGIPYFVNGLGGAPYYDFRDVVAGSRARHTGEHGAMLANTTRHVANFTFYTTDGVLVDEHRQCRAWEWRPGVHGCMAGAWGGRSR